MHLFLGVEKVAVEIRAEETVKRDDVIAAERTRISELEAEIDRLRSVRSLRHRLNYVKITIYSVHIVYKDSAVHWAVIIFVIPFCIFYSVCNISVYLLMIIWIIRGSYEALIP